MAEFEIKVKGPEEEVPEEELHFDPVPEMELAYEDIRVNAIIENEI